MMRESIVAFAAAVALAGAAWATDADNSAVNQRDKSGTTLTAFDQGEGADDLRITASLREMVVQDDSLSINAHNIKIITVSGEVTLRGPVASPAEKASIETKARSVKGVTKISNQLEVAQGGN
jgi:hyperosmotically inducible periplasmic protein